ncbi:hypothetical protein N658DRAFT_562190 [Parathielavia hyrcaniae]|uniref:Dynamin GTPase domain-containing protein n=1 Tax=Parathielavia hyrcaniae TaxID=113614 RepID=A0AAN6SXW1_9PEZI|nr:hypothetical protein N658DRAFT_562190 [Parathielavia hyrcaniae]
MPHINGHNNGVPGAMLTPSRAEDAQILAAMDNCIIVCGAQSAGKSSALESLVQVPFPRSNNMCTRYVTKVTMLQEDTPSIQVRIHPSPDRSEAEAEKLSCLLWQEDNTANYAVRLATFREEAHWQIFTGSAKAAITTRDILQITVFGPGIRPLEVLDLPGLIEYVPKNSGNDGVPNLIKSIILAVIKANEDLNNQGVLGLCEEHDPKGERTLGIITRPDLAEPSQRESLIKHVLRNRSFAERDATQEVHDYNERVLLEAPPWNEVPKHWRGISELRERLGERLFSLAKRELPGLCATLRAKLMELEKHFEALGGREFREGELESAVAGSLKRPREAARDHARGIYESDIRSFLPDSAVRLRSRIIEKAEVFQDRLTTNGHAWETLVRPTTADPDADLGSVYKEPPPDDMAEIKRHESLPAEILEIVKLLKQTRSQMLPGFPDPRRIADLFWRMSEGWSALARDYIKQAYICCERYFREVTPMAFKREEGGSPGFSNSHKIAGRCVGPHIIPRLDRCRERAWEELRRLEKDRSDAPINADMTFLKERRAHRQGRAFDRVMKATHQLEGHDKSKGLDPTTYYQHAGLHTQDELAAKTAETYLDAMWSHYLIERHIYINVLRQVVERHFLRNMGDIVARSWTRRLSLNSRKGTMRKRRRNRRSRRKWKL